VGKDWGTWGPYGETVKLESGLKATVTQRRRTSFTVSLIRKKLHQHVEWTTQRSQRKNPPKNLEEKKTEKKPYRRVGESLRVERTGEPRGHACGPVQASRNGRQSLERGNPYLREGDVRG